MRFATRLRVTRLSITSRPRTPPPNARRQRQSHQSLEEHLRYLAERAADRLHASYALVRTVTWAVPILGFLGTVIGITMAIANISPSELQSSLTDVISGLSISLRR